MGRTVYAEESLLNYLEPLTITDAYTVGLILGQSCEDKDYVVHLARTPPPASKDVIEETLIGSTVNVQQESPVKHIQSISDVPSSWVADHAKHVTRMLPGGMWVLGIFIVAPNDCLNNNDSSQKLKSIVTTIHKNLASDPYLYGNNPKEHLIFAFNSNTKRFMCKSFDLSSNALKAADWKFQSKITKWYQIETRVDFNQIYPVVDGEPSETLKTQLQKILENISTKLESSMILIDGELRDQSELIEVVGEKRRKENKEAKSNGSTSVDKALQATIFIPCQPTKPNSQVKLLSCTASLRLVGQLVSRTFLNQKSTAKDAANAIKQDIIRSMVSRLEMHWDSLIEEENGLPEDNITLHEPPRRVLVALPQSRITLSDYLFPGEGPQEALISLQELLDLEVQESSVQQEIELQADPSEFYCQNEKKHESDEPGKYSENNYILLYISGLSAAITILIAAILLHYLY